MYKITGYMLSNGDGCVFLDEPVIVHSLLEISSFERERQVHHNCNVDAIYQHLCK